MIYTVTFNPALDVSGVVDNLIPDEKNYVRDEMHMPGGNGLNAGIIAHRLKREVILTGLMGGSNGEEVKRLLDKSKIPHSFVEISGMTRMNLTIANKNDHRQTRLSFPGPLVKTLEAKNLSAFLHKVTPKDIILLGGSLPLGLNTTYVVNLIKSLRSNGILCLVDMPGNLLKDIISAKPSFIKPNLSEFQILIGKKVTSLNGVVQSARRLLDCVPVICVSSVEGGAVLMNKNEVWFGKIPSVRIRSTVGAGDSMVGAMTSVWDRNPSASIEELLRLGLSASCATLTEPGLSLGSRRSILKYQSQIKLKKL